MTEIVVFFSRRLPRSFLTPPSTLNNARAVNSTARPFARHGEQLHMPFSGTGRRLGGGGQGDPTKRGHSMERRVTEDTAAGPQSLSSGVKVSKLRKGENFVFPRPRVDKVHPPPKASPNDQCLVAFASTLIQAHPLRKNPQRIPESSACRDWAGTRIQPTSSNTSRKIVVLNRLCSEFG